MDDLQVTRKPAAKYLSQLVQIGVLSKHRLSKENYYLNDGLIAILLNAGGLNAGGQHEEKS
jgi:hypothetical protein